MDKIFRSKQPVAKLAVDAPVLPLTPPLDCLTDWNVKPSQMRNEYVSRLVLFMQLFIDRPGVAGAVLHTAS